MVFPPPTGILELPAILEAARAGLRWNAVEMTERAGGGGGVPVLAHRARARRAGAPDDALCASTWCSREGRWRLVAHRQTPAG